MQKRKQKTKYLLPVTLAVILVVSLVFGVFLMRNSLMRLTVEERSNQLEEMVTQIQENLTNGLQPHWNLVEGLNNATQGQHFENTQELCDNIALLEKVFCTDMYGSRVMLLDAQGTAYLRNGSVGIWNDVIDVRNVFKALEEVKYIQNQSFETVKAQLEKDGIATANILLNETEYCCCLTSMDAYNMILMLLIPADCVAVSTMNMMDSTIRTETIFISAMAFMMLLTFVSFVRVQRSRQRVKMEQETNKELNQLRLEAESANAAKSTFLNNMSHDIRTPMNAIIGFTNIAMKHQPPAEIKSCLDKISDSSEHLLALINDVLDISRIESGKIRYVPTPVDLVEVTNSVLTIMYGYLSNRNINFQTELAEPEIRYVMTDAVRVREVLVNILGNAVKFTNDGGTVTYAVSYRRGKDERFIHVQYRITDTGIGMSDEFVNYIFDEFSQEEHGARTQYKGTGLGMAITKRYVDLMGGTITVESRKGVGSTFTVELPMEITDARMNGHLSKPIVIDEVVKTIARNLDK